MGYRAAAELEARQQQVDKKTLYSPIREEVVNASRVEEAKGPFNLFGRGCEPRVTLDRTMAGILRGHNFWVWRQQLLSATNF